MTEPSAALRGARSDDLHTTARLHRDQLGHGFFVALGPAFLAAYHRTFVDSPYGIGLVADHGGEVVGFLFGTLNNRLHYRWVVRWRLPDLGWNALLGMLRRPRLTGVFLKTRLRRYIGAVRRRIGRGWQGESADGGPEAGDRAIAAVLMHVAVDPAWRGQGIGSRLTDRFLVGATAVGAHEAQLVTLSGSAGAADFYRERGWTLIGHRSDPDGNPVCVFRRSLRTPP